MSPTSETQARIELAALYRLANLFGYDDLIWNHITMRVPNTENHFLMNRFGLLNTEIKASNLIKLDGDGNVLDGPKDINTTGFVIHSAIHNAHHDMKVVFHSHAPEVLAAATLKSELDFLILDSASMYGEIGYHEWEGMSIDLDERERIADNVRGKKALILRNHGFITAGETAGQAFMYMHYLVRACRVMLQARATGLPLSLADTGVWQTAHKQYENFAPGEHEWPALIRMLDKIDSSYKD